MLIKKITARKIKDSRNEPTIEVSVNGQKASSPSGKSTGKYETLPYHRSLKNSIKEINSLKIPFEINSFQDLKKLESFIKRKFKLKDANKFGANALFALESAILKALAKSQNKQLWQVINPTAKKIPIPVGNAIGGGLHSHNKDAPEFQEFLLIPLSPSIKQNVKTLNQIYKTLKRTIKAHSKNDEGAWQTSLSNEEIFSILSKFKDIRIGVDVASSSFYKNAEYVYKNKSLNTNAQINYIDFLIKAYNLFYIEDPFQENDFNSFSKLRKLINRNPKTSVLAGDDLTATHLSRLKKAISSNSINAMIIKPNQNGSLLELEKIFRLCKKHKIRTILSHRSGETLDPALADYAVAFQSDFIKTGISTKWRKVKLKRLIQIEKSLRDKHQYL